MSYQFKPTEGKLELVVIVEFHAFVVQMSRGIVGLWDKNRVVQSFRRLPGFQCYFDTSRMR